MKMRKRIAVGAAALCLAVSAAMVTMIPALADGAESELSQTGLELLLESLRENQAEDGVVTLSGDVEVPAEQEVILSCGAPVQILTGGYRFEISGSLTLGGGLSILSDGGVPVFTVKDGGTLNFDLSGGSVLAGVKEGGSGTLIAVEEGGSILCTGTAAGGRLRLSASGAGSVGIDSLMPLDLANVEVHMPGAGSIGVRSTGKIHLLSSLVISGGITIDAPEVDLGTAYPYPRQVAPRDGAYDLEFLYASTRSQDLKVWRTYNDGADWAEYPAEQTVWQDGILTFHASSEDLENPFALCFQVDSAFSGLYRVGLENGVIQAAWDNVALDPGKLPTASPAKPEAPEEDGKNPPETPEVVPPETVETETPVPVLPVVPVVPVLPVVPVVPSDPEVTPSVTSSTLRTEVLPDVDPPATSDPNPSASPVETVAAHANVDADAEPPVTQQAAPLADRAPQQGQNGYAATITDQNVPLIAPETSGADAADPYTTTVSGARIAELLASDLDLIPFRKNMIQVWIPADALAALNLAPEDRFSVRAFVTETQISLDLWVNDQPIDIRDVQVGISWDGQELSVSTEAGNPVPFRYTPEDALLVVTLPGVGVYQLNPVLVAGTAAARGEAENTAEGNPINSPMATTTIFSFAGAGLFGILWRVLGKRLVWLLD